MDRPYLFLATSLVLSVISAAVVDAGPNESAVLPLHAIVDPGGAVPCDVGDPCDPGPATVNVPPLSDVAVYLLLRSHSNVAGVQTAFDWSGWSLIGGTWSCQSNQVIGTQPHGTGGPIDGTVATAFDCVLGPETAVIGALRFTAAGSGCVTQVESGFPFGTILVSCTDELDPVPAARRGAVCVDQGGIDACGPAVPVHPVCDAGGPYEGFTYRPVTFDGTASLDPDGTIVAYDWTFGDGTGQSGAIVEHAYNDPGTFAVTLCVTDNDNLTSCCGTTATIAIGPLPPICDAGGPYAADLGESIAFDGSGSHGASGTTIVSYDWEFGDGATGGGVAPTHAYGAGGHFTVTLTVTDDTGGHSDCTTDAAINLPPTCDAGGPYAASVCTAIHFDGTGSSDPDGMVVSYDWEFGDGHGGAGATAQHAYVAGGTFVVTLTVTDDTGSALACVTSAEIDASNPPDPLTPIIGVDPPSLDFGCVEVGTCDDLSVALFNDQVDPCSELLVTGLTIGGDDAFEIVSPPPVPFVLPGDGTAVSITVRCCAAAAGPLAATLVIESSNAANSPLDVPLAALGNLPPICDAGAAAAGNPGDPLQFDGSASSDPEGVVVDYAWDFGDGHTVSAVMPTHAYESGGLYTVTLTVTDDCGGTSSCTTTADVNFLPDCDAGGPYETIEEEPIEFDGTGSSDPDGVIVDYAWDFGDGSTGAGPVVWHSYFVGGYITATLCVTDDGGAEACCDAEVYVAQPAPVELARFEATSSDGSVHLEWATSPVDAGRTFDVERSDDQGAGFVVVSTAPVEPAAGDPTAYVFTDRGVEPGATYTYRLQSIDPRTGAREASQVMRVTVARVLPRRLALRQNRPNPFNPSTTIRFEVPAPGHVSLRIYDGAGRLVRTLVDRSLAHDAHVVEWDGRDDRGRAVGSGIYLCRLRSSDAVLQQKMVLVR